MKTGIIIQARLSSTRLPNKILLSLPYGGDTSVLGNVIKRSKKACCNVIVATTDRPEDLKTVEEAEKYGAETFRGSMDDVLSRYLGAANAYGFDTIVRITSDCPAIDPALISDMVETFNSSNADYLSNVESRTFPHGLDIEVFSKSALEKADKDETLIEIREHVTLHIRRSDDFKKIDYICPTPLTPRPDIRITIDTPEDYTALVALFSYLGEDFNYTDIINLYDSKPWLLQINNRVYQKNAFTNISEEMIEALKLLKLHSMLNAAKLIEDSK